MRHIEGGWPKDVDASEQGDVTRFRKKAEKDEEYKSAVKSLGPIIARCMKQVNTIDIYEEYFITETIDHSSEPPSAKGLAVFRDPNEIKRTATSINWHPDPSISKLAVSYSCLNFQDSRYYNSSSTSSSSSSNKLSNQSYIWDILNPNTPDIELSSASPLCCIRYNSKNTDTLISGSYNGLISFYDLRRSGNPISSTTGTAAPNSSSLNLLNKEILPYSTSLIEKSHHDPIYEIFWINSKTGNQCCSVSTDGQMLWWDTRKLNEPTDQLYLRVDIKNNNNSGKTFIFFNYIVFSYISFSFLDGMLLGGSSMEYNSEAGPSKYLIGTEQGIVLMVNLKNRKQGNASMVNNGITVFDQGPGKHHGPIYSIQRNPSYSKCFITVGDWTAKIWMEDIKTPIMTTKYHPSYLTAGCWSPIRSGLFFVTRMDGVLDIWDYFYR